MLECLTNHTLHASTHFLNVVKLLKLITLMILESHLLKMSNFRKLMELLD